MIRGPQPWSFNVTGPAGVPNLCPGESQNQLVTVFTLKSAAISDAGNQEGGKLTVIKLF